MSDFYELQTLEGDIEDRRPHYNQVRPHSSLDDETPESFSKKISTDLLTGAIPI